MDAANKAKAQLESERKAAEIAQAKAKAEAIALTIIEKRTELEAKELEEALLRESVERMANEAIIARTEENKKATAAATERYAPHSPQPNMHASIQVLKPQQPQHNTLI